MFKDRNSWNSDNELFYGKTITKKELEERETIPLVVIFAIIEIIVDISCRWEIIEWFIRKILWIYGFLLAIRLIHERKKEGTR